MASWRSVPDLLLDAPHRLLFLFAALSGLGGASSWIWLPDGADPVALHRNLFLGGMAQAAVCGYVLTALPGWTASPRPRPRDNAVLAVLWLAGLPALVTPSAGWPLPAASLGLAVALLAFLRFLRAGALVRAPVLVFLPLLVAGWNALPDGPASRLAPAPETVVLLIAGLIGLIGGRALPAFGRFWQAAPRKAVPAEGALPGLAGLTLALGLLAIDHRPEAGVFLCLAGIAFLIRSRAWPWRAALAYPALLILYLSWLWLPAGLLAAGIALISGHGSVTDTLHALTAGAISTMIYGFMARAAMDRIEGRLRLGRRLGTGYIAMVLAALLRTGLSFDLLPAAALRLSAVLMALAWLFFLSAYGQHLARPSPRPVFSAHHTRPRGSGPVRPV